MFHVNAWGIPYAAFLSGASLLMPGRYMQAEPLCRFIEAERPTLVGRPDDLGRRLQLGAEHEIDLSSLRVVVCGGSAMPRSLMEAFQKQDGVRSSRAGA